MQISRSQSLSNCRNRRFTSKAGNGGRSGSVLLEFILAFPIILIISLAVIQFGFFALLQQTVTIATIEGSRKAAQVGSTTDSVGNLIQQYVALNSLDLQVVSPATSNTGNVLVTIETGPAPVTTVTIGNSDIPCTPVGPAPGIGEVKVTVCMNLTDSNGTSPIPNLLSSFGFTLSGKQIEISAMTGLE
tara:strand:+ start:3821 stop:4384 length:564 start_codon:yes stop_codon:yes gene_type:complete